MLDEHAGAARVLAGGQSLVPMLHMRLMQPERASIDINGLDELGGIDAPRRATTVLGALVRYASDRALADRRRSGCRCCSAWSATSATAQVRNRGTLGGSLAQADPTGEMPLACLALDATVVARERRAASATIPIEDFLVGAYATALEPDELLTEVRFPPRRTHCAFFERGRRHNDFAVLSVAVARPPRRRRALGRPADRARRRQRPRRCSRRAAAGLLEGTALGTTAIAEAAQAALEVGRPARRRARLAPSTGATSSPSTCAARWRRCATTRSGTHA